MSNIFRRSVLTFVCVLATLCAGVFGIEPADIHMPLTRDEADRTLSKDYEYAVLEDGTVRRTWQLSDKSIFIDFDTATNEAIMVAIVYKQPVAKKIGLEDANALADNKYKKGAKWEAPKDRAAKERVEREWGMKNAKRKKLEGDASIYYEASGKKDHISRVSLHARNPHKNRWILQTTSGEGRRTALGNQTGSSSIKALYSDEARRKAIPLAENAPTAEEDTAPESTVKVNTPTVTITHKTPVAPKAATPSPVTVTPPQPVENTATPQPRQPQPVASKSAAERTESALPPPPDWLKQFGVEEPTWGHYIGLGIVALLLLIFILRAIIGSANKAAQRKKYEKILSGEDEDDDD